MAEARYCVSLADGFYVGLYIQDCVERRKSERVDVDIATTIIKLANAVEAQEKYPIT